MAKKDKKISGALQDVEFDALSVIKIPSGEIGSFNYSVLKLKIKNGEIISTELTEPNIKQIALDTAKIMFMKTFFYEDIAEAMKRDV